MISRKPTFYKRLQIELTLDNASGFSHGKRSCGNRFYLGLQDDTTFTNGLNAMV